MFNFIYLIIQVQSFRIRQIQNESLSFELPYFKETNITTICAAKDTQLISNNNEPFCWLEKLNLEYDTKLQPFDKIVTMANIRDGILVITSDFFLYMLKFNYQNFSSEFAKITWKADFKELGLDSTAEIPSLLYCSTSNLGILFYSQTAMIFSVQQMEQKSSSLSVKEITDLKQRKERGVTKEYDNYIFSCVGSEGLDIYKISGTELHFIEQIQGLRVKDLVIIKQEQIFYLILLEDSTPSITVYEIDTIKIRTSIKLLYQIITKKREYVAVDNYQNNIFVVFKQHHKYVCIEYLFTVKDFIQLNEFTTYSKIKDVDVTEDFAILQGQDKHKIMFVTKFEGLQIKHVPRFIISGVMDIEVFYLTNIDLQMSHLQDSNNFSLEKFFFGSSKSGLFFTRYKFQDPYIACYAENEVEDNEQFYQIISNESVSFAGDITQNIIIQRTTNFTIKAYDEQDNDYMSIVAYLGIPIGGTFILMGIISWYITKKKEVEKLETEISTIKSRRASALTAAVEFQPQMIQMINQQGVMSPIAVTARNDLKTNLAKEDGVNVDG